MSETDSHPVNEDAYEQLVAYLDGELDSDSSQQVEERLARDAAYRRELQWLQRTWDVLDELPRADVGAEFTQTTVEVVTLSAERELLESKTVTRKRQTLLWGLAGALVVAVAATSYVAVSAFLQRPTRQLARDYPIIDNIELFTIADSVDFLHRLDDEGLFAQQEVDDGL